MSMIISKQFSTGTQANKPLLKQWPKTSLTRLLMGIMELYLPTDRQGLVKLSQLQEGRTIMSREE